LLLSKGVRVVPPGHRPLTPLQYAQFRKYDALFQILTRAAATQPGSKHRSR